MERSDTNILCSTREHHCDIPTKNCIYSDHPINVLVTQASKFKLAACVNIELECCVDDCQSLWEIPSGFCIKIQPMGDSQQIVFSAAFQKHWRIVPRILNVIYATAKLAALHSRLPHCEGISNDHSPIARSTNTSNTIRNRHQSFTESCCFIILFAKIDSRQSHVTLLRRTMRDQSCEQKIMEVNILVTIQWSLSVSLILSLFHIYVVFQRQQSTPTDVGSDWKVSRSKEKENNHHAGWISARITDRSKTECTGMNKLSRTITNFPEYENEDICERKCATHTLIVEPATMCEVRLECVKLAASSVHSISVKNEIRDLYLPST